MLGVYILNSLQGPHRPCVALFAFCPMPSFRKAASQSSHLGQRVSLSYNTLTKPPGGVMKGGRVGPELSGQLFNIS